MNPPSALYIERNPCGSCFRCVRECSPKAIVLSNHQREIDPARCVECGECLSKCAYGYIRLRDDINEARALVKSAPRVVASLAPEWAAEFEGMESRRLIEALRLLGFAHVSESALAHAQIIEREQESMREKSGLVISGRCPAVRNYIKKYRPRLIGALTRGEYPADLHARMIRRWWGEDTAVVHITSCVAMKDAQGPDATLSFAELKRWMWDEGIDFDKIAGADAYRFEPQPAREGLLYMAEGGSGAKERVIVKSGMDSIEHLLRVHPSPETPLLLDLMACEGGCPGSAATSLERRSMVARRQDMESAAQARALDPAATDPATPDTLIPDPAHTDAGPGLPDTDLDPVDFFVAEADTLKALDALGLSAEGQRSNCGACGYGTCRRFAKALSRSVVSRDMCINFTLTEMRARFTTLIEKLSAGVALVSGSGRIIEANRQMAVMLGADAVQIFNAIPGMEEVDAQEVLPFWKHVSSVLQGENPSLVRDIQLGDRVVTVSIHTVQKHKMAIVICRNIQFSQVRNEEIVARTRKVIDENLDTVHKIARLLGENASRTEAILNSILDSQIVEKSDG